MNDLRRSIVRFHSPADTTAAAAEIARGAAGSALTVLFASTDHDLAEFGRALAARSVRHVVGAATGRVIGATGFEPHGVTGFHLPSGRFAAADAVIEDAAAISLPEARELVRRLRSELGRSAGTALEHHFAVLFVDADARCEERLTAMLGMELNGVPLVGGSAGDVYFNPRGHAPGSTRILHHGRALRGAAVLCLVASASPIVAYCHNHYVTSDRKVVITGADPARRLVSEIDGYPALKVYASLCGFRRPPRDSRDFAPYPLMIRIGGQYYARGMQRIDADGTLEFACALEPGLVVSIARPGDMVACLADLFAAMRATIGTPDLVIGLDCAARTAYMEQRALTAGVASLLKSHAVTGFATLGEQFNTIHANNSFTCLGIAAPS
ncbi:MAG TPA: FIST N-terminal domain-containing protein [Steroidobacteraceae bacterium]|nr:FIST N-terminal domain-containing protein [Steroidobacteraceae bacterium]